MKKLSKIKIFLFLLLAILIYITYMMFSVYSFSNQDDKEKSDVIIVLGASTYQKEPAPVYRERLNHGINLYNEGYSDKIIVTGGSISKNALSDAEIASDYLIKKGIPKEDILIEDISRYTEENLSYSKAIMEKNSLKTAIIVSDPYHMKRSIIIGEYLGIKCKSSPTKTSMYRSTNKKLPFLLKETFLTIGYEIYTLF